MMRYGKSMIVLAGTLIMASTVTLAPPNRRGRSAPRRRRCPNMQQS